MRFSLLLRAMLLLPLMLLLLDAAASQKNSSRKEKTKFVRKTNSQKKCFWVTLDSTLNFQMKNPPSSERSLSPWTYKNSSDISRIPSEIWEAKCEKRGCLTANGEEDLSLESKPIYYQINVLKRVKSKNAAHYTLKLKTKKVSVGCTCVSSKVATQN